jgi:membrane dipeptidase
MNITRRKIISTLALASLSQQLLAQSLIPISDAHNHFGLLRNNRGATSQLKSLMEKSGVYLISWAVVPDIPFLSFGSSGVRQSKTPNKGELQQSYERQIMRAVGIAEANGLKVIKTPDDLIQAGKGVPSIVLTSEGADFLEGAIDGLLPAVNAGLRHIQLVHYIKNNIGDIQTEAVEHNGLSPFGKSLITAMNNAGVLIDVAHGTQEMVEQSLAISKSPLIWSHSYLAQSHGAASQSGYQSRAIGIDLAKRIAGAGGAVGLWALGPSLPGGGIRGYVEEIIRMIDVLGPEHVMFGTDIDGLPAGAVISDFGDLRAVVVGLQKRGLDEKTIRAVSYANYERCLNRAMLNTKVQ